MTITYDWPADLKPTTASFRLRANGLSHTSAFTGSTQTVGFPGSRWVLDLSFDNRITATARKLAGFLAKLNGQEHRFRMHDHFLSSPRGVATGSPTVNGAGVTGFLIPTAGWTPSTTGILLYGDMISIGGELKMISDDVDSDGSGNATVHVSPPLRKSPVNGSAILTQSAVGIWMLSTNEVSTSWRQPAIGSIQFSAEEDIL